MFVIFLIYQTSQSEDCRQLFALLLQNMGVVLEMKSGSELIALCYMHEHLFLSLVSF